MGGRELVQTDEPSLVHKLFSGVLCFPIPLYVSIFHLYPKRSYSISHFITYIDAICEFTSEDGKRALGGVDFYLMLP